MHFMPFMYSFYLFVLSLFSQFCSCSEQNVSGRVQSSFAGVLNYAYDEAYTYYLHSDVVRNTEQGTCQRNQQQGTAGYAGSTACGDCRQYAQENCRVRIAMVIAAPPMLMVAPRGMEME